jgi:drug/metabolite transporter (DMT)-like permease
LGLKILILARIGFIIAIVGLFIVVVSYFLQQDLVLGIALLIIGIIIFATGSSINPEERH